jgi:threonine dehydratase
VLVSEEEILSAMRLMLEDEHWVIEGAAGVAAAAFRKEAKQYAEHNVAVVVCGRNVSEGVGRRLFGRG